MTFGIFTTFPTEAVVLSPHPFSTRSPSSPPPTVPCVVVHGNCILAVASKIEMKGTSSTCGVAGGRGAGPRPVCVHRCTLCASVCVSIVELCFPSRLFVELCNLCKSCNKVETQNCPNRAFWIGKLFDWLQFRI